MGVGGGASARAFRNPDSTCTRVRIPCRVRALSPWMGSRWFARRRGVVAWWGLGGLPGWGFRLGTRRHGGSRVTERWSARLPFTRRPPPRVCPARPGRRALHCPVPGARIAYAAQCPSCFHCNRMFVGAATGRFRVNADTSSGDVRCIICSSGFARNIYSREIHIG